MSYKGSEVYDDDDFFNKYIEKRNLGKSPNELLEKPIIDELIGAVSGKEVLDIGCGSGLYGKELMEKGATAYHGIDGSENMIALASTNLSAFDCKLEQIDVELLQLAPASYDLVLSRLVFHYIEHLAPVFRNIHQSLNPGGHFIFSIEHPLITSNYESYHQKGKIKRGSWIVDNYFDSGKRINIWIEKEVVKYHKTIEEYIQLINDTGFAIEAIRESKPKRIHFTDHADYERRKRIPLFMIFKLKNSA